MSAPDRLAAPADVTVGFARGTGDAVEVLAGRRVVAQRFSTGGLEDRPAVASVRFVAVYRTSYSVLSAGVSATRQPFFT